MKGSLELQELFTRAKIESLSQRALAVWLLLQFLLLLPGCTSTTQRGLAERYYNIATDYYKGEDYQQAVSYFALALQEAPNLQLVHLNYGLALIETKNYQEAERQLLKAYQVDQRNTVSLSALGYLSFRLENYEASADWYRKSVGINEYNPETYYNLGIVEQKLGNYEASQRAFDRLPEIQEAKQVSKEVRRFAAVNQLYFGAQEKAMQLYSEYFAERGNSEQIFQDVYDFYTEQQQYEAVLSTFAIFEESIANNPLAAYLLAELYYQKLGNPVEGLASFKQAISRRFRDKERLEGLVKSLKGADRKAAQQEFDQANL